MLEKVLDFSKNSTISIGKAHRIQDLEGGVGGGGPNVACDAGSLQTKGKYIVITKPFKVCGK